jgi:hypothetical protein
LSREKRGFLCCVSDDGEGWMARLCRAVTSSQEIEFRLDPDESGPCHPGLTHYRFLRLLATPWQLATCKYCLPIVTEKASGAACRNPARAIAPSSLARDYFGQKYGLSLSMV